MAHAPHEKPHILKVQAYLSLPIDKLPFWYRKVGIALKVARISEDRQKVSFALSHLVARARDWYLTNEISTPGYFRDWDELKTLRKAVFLPPNAAFRERAKFIQCVQGKRTLKDYIKELRALVIGM